MLIQSVYKFCRIIFDDICVSMADITMADSECCHGMGALKQDTQSKMLHLDFDQSVTQIMKQFQTSERVVQRWVWLTNG